MKSLSLSLRFCNSLCSPSLKRSTTSKRSVPGLTFRAADVKARLCRVASSPKPHFQGCSPLKSLQVKKFNCQKFDWDLNRDRFGQSAGSAAQHLARGINFVKKLNYLTQRREGVGFVNR